MQAPPAAFQLCLLAMVAVAAVTDLRSHRIPNWLVAAGLIVAMILQVAQAGLGAGAQNWMYGALVGFIPFVFLYVVGGMGAGDAKLMAAVGAFAGPDFMLPTLLATAVAGGAMALVSIVAGHNARSAMARVGALLMAIPFGMRALKSKSGSDGVPQVRLPYAVAIAIGVGAALLYAGTS